MRAVKLVRRPRKAKAGAGIKKNKASSNHAKVPPRPPASHNTATVAYVSAEDADALDCSICFLPLKAPIFQCDVGHAVCSPCHDMLKSTGKCHMCGVTTQSFRRCHTMERVMEAIRAPCQNAAYGCTARPAYHDLEGHIQKCLHGPCCCPDKDCSFVGSREALLGHFSGVHGWLCTNTMADGRFKARLKNGFNFLHADHCASTPGLLFVLKVIRSPLVGCAISVLRIRPNAATNGQGPSSTECELVYSRYVTARSRRGGDQLTDHYQRCKFRVACTNGLPSPGECFQLLVPDFALGEENKETIKVDGRIFTG